MKYTTKEKAQKLKTQTMIFLLNPTGSLPKGLRIGNYYSGRGVYHVTREEFPELDKTPKPHCVSCTCYAYKNRVVRSLCGLQQWSVGSTWPPRKSSRTTHGVCKKCVRKLTLLSQ